MPAYYNEIDPYACSVLRARIASGELPEGDVDERDIRLVTPADIAPYTAWHFFAGIGGGALSARMAGIHDDARHATNGFPCQDISFAGKGAGLLGNRSGLFFTSMKLLSAIRPSATLSENVAALLSRGLDTVIAEFTTDGFDVEWCVISANDVGAPHQRERVWILAYPSGALQAPSGAHPFARLEGDSWYTDQATLLGGYETYGAHDERWPRAGFCVGGRAYRVESAAMQRSGALWPTPTASAGGQNATSPSSYLAREGEGRHGLNLLGAALVAEQQLWTTPSARDWKDTEGMATTREDGRTRIDQLPRQVFAEARGIWPTPTTQDSVGSRRETARTDEWKSNPGTTLTDAAIIAGGEWDGKPMVDGTKLGRLNPAWVATLMGYPPDWGIVASDRLFYRIPERSAHAIYAGGQEWPSSPGVAQREWEPPRLVPNIAREGRQALAGFGNAWVPQAAVVAWRHAIAVLER